MLPRLLSDPTLAADAVRALTAAYAGTTRLILDRFGTLPAEARGTALAALASRQSSAEALLRAVRAGHIPRADVPTSVVRQLRDWDDDPIPGFVEAIWGRQRPVSAGARQRVDRLRAGLTDRRLAGADPSRGRALFDRICAQCHRLFGAGGAVGPELTGAQRGDLGYLLENILDPNATLAPDYRMSVFALADGRVVNGLVAEGGERTVTIQTPTERLVVPGARSRRSASPSSH